MTPQQAADAVAEISRLVAQEVAPPRPRAGGAHLAACCGSL